MSLPKAEDNEKQICCMVDCENREPTAAESRATYAELKRYVLEKHGLKVSSLYIAQIKRKYGLEMGVQYHKAADPNKKMPVCPPAKEEAIKEALVHYRMLDASASVRQDKTVAQ